MISPIMFCYYVRKNNQAKLNKCNFFLVFSQFQNLFVMTGMAGAGCRLLDVFRRRYNRTENKTALYKTKLHA